MTGISTYAAGKFLGWIKGTGAGSAPGTVYAALFNGDPLDDGSGGTEVTTDVRGAGRVAVTFGAVSSKRIANSAAVDFGDSDSDVDVDYTALFDDPTAGNMLGSGALPSPRSITAGDPVAFDIGDMVYNLNDTA